jgi:hypothetical protein
MTVTMDDIKIGTVLWTPAGTGVITDVLISLASGQPYRALILFSKNIIKYQKPELIDVQQILAMKPECRIVNQEEFWKTLEQEKQWAHSEWERGQAAAEAVFATFAKEGQRGS